MVLIDITDRCSDIDVMNHVGTEQELWSVSAPRISRYFNPQYTVLQSDLHTIMLVKILHVLVV